MMRMIWNDFNDGVLCSTSVIPADAGIQGAVGILPILPNHAHHSSKARM